MDKTLEDNSCLSLDLNFAPIQDSGDIARNTDFNGNDLDDESKLSEKENQSGNVIQQLNQIKKENKKLTEMLFLVCENYNVLQNHMMDLMQKSPGNSEVSTRKRKFEPENTISTYGNHDIASNIESICDDKSPKRPKEITTNISKVLFRTDPDDKSLVVKDGYHWRKYGQKVTKDNPSPRAYFKCSFAPTCQVKKKVQRSVGNAAILVATYEGEHNHQPPLQADHHMLVASPQGAVTPLPAAAGANCSDFSMDTGIGNNRIQSRSFEENAVQNIMVEQMASSLTRNPSFTAALVAAISGRILSREYEYEYDTSAEK
uniref:WRKY18 n=1 Tax=Catharanthus roseus TaxID=4058 RepID=K7PEY0_CATRO|nr:WRKY18 [Catharanthus roseus]